MKSILAALIITVIGTQAQACTLEEFNQELAKFNQETSMKLDKLGEMLNTLSDKDLEKINGTEVAQGASEGDYLVTGAEYLYTGIDIFNTYLDNKPTK